MGASENALSFKGCTLPGVMTAGAIQTMININRVLPGTNALTVGTGNVGLIVSYQWMQGGGKIAGMVEGADTLGGYQVHGDKIARKGVPFYFAHTILEARGDNEVEEAVIGSLDENFQVDLTKKTKIIPVDVICLSVGLKPRIELPQMLGYPMMYNSLLGGHFPIYNGVGFLGNQIYIDGDLAGVEEASSALDEGRLAGIAVALALGCINEEKGKAMIRVCKERLKKLRSGPFGEKRYLAKEEICREWQSYEN